LFFNPDQNCLGQSPHPGGFDDDPIHDLSYPLTGLSGEHESQPIAFSNQLGVKEGAIYPFNTEYGFSPTALTSIHDTSPGSSAIDSQTAPSSVLSHEDIAQNTPKTRTSSKKRPGANSKKQKPPAQEPPGPPRKTRRQPKRDANKAITVAAEENGEHKAQNMMEPEPKSKKPKNRRQRSLERNRAAASKCRKRKKQWTENLEDKRSRLESIHQALQAEYMNLLQESSQLKNFLISHASCQDPNIDIWIKNEASKYVQSLQSSRRSDSLLPVPSLDGESSQSIRGTMHFTKMAHRTRLLVTNAKHAVLENGFTSQYSSSTSPLTSIPHGSPGFESQDSGSEPGSDDDDLLEEDVE
jgi:hypothetical protein